MMMFLVPNKTRACNVFPGSLSREQRTTETIVSLPSSRDTYNCVEILCVKETMCPAVIPKALK